MKKAKVKMQDGRLECENEVGKVFCTLNRDSDFLSLVPDIC